MVAVELDRLLKIVEAREQVRAVKLMQRNWSLCRAATPVAALPRPQPPLLLHTQGGGGVCKGFIPCGQFNMSKLWDISHPRLGLACAANRGLR